LSYVYSALLFNAELIIYTCMSQTANISH